MATNQNMPEKRVTKTIEGSAKIQKKSSLSKIRDMFIAEDADKVGTYILMDILVPSIKRSIVDIIKSSADIIFGTKGSQSSVQTKYSYGPQITHVTYGSSFARKQQETTENNRSSAWDFSCVEFSQYDRAEDNKRQADTAIDEMCNIISAYGVASVADLCEIINCPCEYTANDYGWKDLHTVAPVKMPGSTGYYLRFPKAYPIDKK